MTITITDEIKETLKTLIELHRSSLSSEKTTEVLDNIRKLKPEDFTDDIKENIVTIIEHMQSLLLTDVNIIETLISEEGS